MNNENTLKLYHDFPYLFREAVGGAGVSCMGRGFECGDGWFQLIYELCQKIEKFAENTGVDRQSEDWPAASQVKEKFGLLRFSVSRPMDEEAREQIEKLKLIPHDQIDYTKFKPRSENPFYQMVDKIIQRSAITCERCGAPATLKTTDGYMSVLCVPCRKQREHEMFLPPKRSYEEHVKEEGAQIEYLKKRLVEVKRDAR